MKHSKNLIYKKILSIAFIGLAFCQSILAKEIQIKQQDVSPQQLKKQNKEILVLAAEQMSKNLPQVINKQTTVVSIKANGTNLIYTYEINTGSKSDEAIIAEDRTEWKKLYIENVCRRSKRFLDAQVQISHLYISAKTKVKLFQFDIDQALCFKIFGYSYGDM